MQRVCAAGLLLVLQLVQQVAGHGVLLQPRSRNWIEYLEKQYYMSHGLNAGGVDVVSNKQKLKYPNGKYGYCGDNHKERRWDVPGQVQATYVQGQVITVDFVVAVNHLGRIDMTICDLDAKPADGKCKQLQRVDGKGTEWYLPFLSNWTGGNAGYVKPAYSDGSFSWYTMPGIYQPEGCKGQTRCNQFTDMIVYRTHWKLPQDYSCKQCKLQWHYLTAHTCWPPCPDKNKDEPTCNNIQVYPTCGTNGVAYPEEFWNCADVRIVGEASRAAVNDKANNEPVWNSKISLQSGKFGSPVSYRMGEFNRHRRQLLSRRSLLSWFGL